LPAKGRYNKCSTFTFLPFCLQAFIIGWTSDLVPKMLYRSQSADDSLEGYVNASLSVFDIADMPLDMRPDPDLYGNHSDWYFCR